MSGSPTDQDLGAYLQSLRTDAGLDAAVLARRLSLSAAQLSQLESGQDTLFYNRRIRQHAARKVILHLGGDLAWLQEPEVDAPLPPVAAPAAPQTAPVQPPAVAVPGPGDRKSGRPARGLWVAGAALIALPLGVAVLAGRIEVPQPSPAPTRLAASTPPATPAPDRALSVSPVSSAETALPMAALPAASAEPPVSTMAPVVAAHKEAVRPDGGACAAAGIDAPPSVQPPQARKPGDMVYVVSLASQELCLVDASGRTQRQRLEAGQAQSFYGQPPWLVRSDQLKQTQLYFQGWRVRLPEHAQDSVQLVELR